MVREAWRKGWFDIWIDGDCEEVMRWGYRIECHVGTSSLRLLAYIP